MQDNKNTMSLKSINFVFDLIEALTVSSSGMYVRELSVKTGMPESAAGRIFQALSDRGYAEQHRSVWKLKLYIIKKVERFSSLRKYSLIGQRRPLYCTALGKSLLIGYSGDRLNAYLINTVLEKFTPDTKTEAASIMEEIFQDRKQGWTLDAEEYESGVICAAAPIYDYRNRIIAAVSASGHAEQTAGELPDISQAVRNAALSISKRMGYKISQQTEERLHL